MVANLKPAEISRVCVGLAGAARPEIAEVVRGTVSEIISGEVKPGKIKTSEIKVVGDNVIALEAAFGSGPGVIVIAGTGSIAYGRNRRRSDCARRWLGLRYLGRGIRATGSVAPPWPPPCVPGTRIRMWMLLCWRA